MKANLLLASLGLAATAAAQSTAERPNVILLVADDLGYGDISCYGATGVETPCIDSIAQGGVRFTDAHACASTSTPSRYSIMTGEYPFRKAGTRVARGDESMIITPEQFTIADVFKAAGYATGAVGKWHLGLGSVAGAQDWNGKLDQDLSDLGFDYHYIMAATADRVPCAFIENGRIANHDPSAPIYVSYRQNFPGEPTGKDNPELLTKLQSSHGHNQAIVNGIGRMGYMKGGGKALWKDENIADSITAHAIRFMEKHSEDPFFLYLGTNDVHVPRYPHERFRGKSPMGLRGEAILQFDWTVKQVVNAMNRLGIAENTLLIITSDNGPVLDDGYKDRAAELLGDHLPSGPFRGGKYGSYEGGCVIPFIVNWPAGAPHGKESKALVSLVDNVASMAELVGVEVPEGAARDSHSHLNTWLGKSDASRPFSVAIGSGRLIDVRQGKWKYIEPKEGMAYPSGPNAGMYTVGSQLYDMSSSVKESTNVAATHVEEVMHFENLIDSVLMGDYAVSFGDDAIGALPERVFKQVAIEGNLSGKQQVDLTYNKKVYVNEQHRTFLAKAGESLTPSFVYNGSNMNGYVYVDYNRDGNYQTILNDDLTLGEGNEAVSFSYYGRNNATSGKNSCGESLSGSSRFVLNPPVFTLPENLEKGYYRMRFKVDYNNINPNGSSCIVDESGKIVDIRLNVHGDECQVSYKSQHGQMVDLQGNAVQTGTLPFGRSVTLKLVPEKGYEIAGLRIKHGYHLDADSLQHGTALWETAMIYREQFVDGVCTVPAQYIDGDVEMEGVFVEEGSYQKPVKPSRYETTVIVNGQFAAATPWYSIQISKIQNVLSDNGNQDYISLGTSTVDPENPAHLWCFEGNEEEGYRIYNRQAGPGKVLAAPLAMEGKNGGSSYPVMVPADQVPADYIAVWRFMDSDKLGIGNEYAYMYEDGFKANKVNKRTDRLAFWTTGQGEGSTLTIKFVKYAGQLTGIDAVEVTPAEGSCYDMGGRKVKNMQKGVYLNNGEKIYRK